MHIVIVQFNNEAFVIFLCDTIHGYVDVLQLFSE